MRPPDFSTTHPTGVDVAKAEGIAVGPDLGWGMQSAPPKAFSQVSSRFVVVDPLGSAAYMAEAGRTYRIITDHLGSARSDFGPNFGRHRSCWWCSSVKPRERDENGERTLGSPAVPPEVRLH